MHRHDCVLAKTGSGMRLAVEERSFAAEMDAHRNAWIIIQLDG
jgi:hypothetical protein